MGKETKVVLDTNVLISSLREGSKPHELVQLVADFSIKLAISDMQIAELERVLQYPKLHISAEQAMRLMNIVYNCAEIVQVSGKLGVVKEDPSDDIILESAIVSKAGFVVTGDGHLLRIREYLWIRIMRVAEFLGEHGRGKIAS